MELTIGTCLTLDNGSKVKSVEGSCCDECIIEQIGIDCFDLKRKNLIDTCCDGFFRSDHKDIIYKEIKE